MRAFCLNGDLSVAYSLFNQMPKRDVVPDVESYRILMQGLCRNSQVNRAVDLLGDMLNKGFVPDTLSYTTLLNSLCRKKKLALNRNAKNKCPSAEIAYKSWNTMLTDGYLYLQLTIVLIFLNIWSWELKVYLIGSLLIVTEERSVPLE